MKSRFLIVFAALSSLATGCVVDNPLAYDPCKSEKDCSGAYADVCILLTQNWGGGDVVSDSICTSKICDTDQECSVSANGSLGYCSGTTAILGAPAHTCFERCYYDGDCSPGFVCAGSKYVAGLDAGEQICVPQGNGVVLVKDPYTTCASLSQCDPALTRCETLSPKWETTPDVFELAICTVACASDASCPTSYNGESGYCANMGDVSGMQVCVERCNTQDDCWNGFLCTPMSAVAGLPDSSDAICLPDPKYAN